MVRLAARRTFRVSFILVLMGGGLLAAGVLGLMLFASASAPGVAELASKRDRALILARHVAQTWRGEVPGSAYFGAFYSQRLPKVLRLPTGLIEAATRPGECSAQVRGLSYLLGRSGIEARQFDIFARTYTHTALQARIGGRWVLIDPYLGVVFRRKDGRLANFAEIAAGMSGLTPVSLFASKPPRIAGMYDRLDGAIGAFSGDRVHMPIWIEGKSVPFILGKRDASASDVERDGIARRMGATIGFLGPRLGSTKNRRIILHGLKRGGVRVTFELVDRQRVLARVKTVPAGACKSSPGRLTCNIRAAASGTAELQISEAAAGWPVASVDWITVARISRED